MTETLRRALEQSLGPTYVLGEELRGGMARVFVARDTALDRRVVVKTLGDVPLDGPQAERFRREILLAAALQHPNIVPLLSTGTTAEGTPYFVMPFVDGTTLRQRLARGAVPPAEVAALVRDAARALGAAHRRGIVHRDIKPENIFVADGVALVGDFGVAKAVDAAMPALATTTGVAVGTPAYMAPEQAGAQPNVGARSDLFALGLVAWELLAGRHPFEGRSTIGLLAALVTEQVPPIASVVPSVPPGLAALVDSLLERDPAHRPADADSVVAALGTILTPSGTEVRPADDAALPRIGTGERAATSAPSDAVQPIVGTMPGRTTGRRLAVAAVGIAIISVIAYATMTGERTAPGGAPPDDQWIRTVWTVPVTQVHVVGGDSGLQAVVDLAAARVRGVTVRAGPPTVSTDPSVIIARRTGDAFVIASGDETLISTLPISLPADDLRARIAGVLLVLNSEPLGAWSLPAGLPPRVELVERFLSVDRLRLQARLTPAEGAQLVDGYDSLAPAMRDWPAPMLLVASRTPRWARRPAFLAESDARRGELTPVEQLLVDLAYARDRGDASRALALLRDLVIMTRYGEFGRAYGGALGDARRLGEGAAVLRAVGPGPGQEHLAYWNSLRSFYHLSGAHEEELEAVGDALGESGMRLGVHWWEMRALAALRRVGPLRTKLAEMAGLPEDAGITYGWLAASVGDELAVHNEAGAAREFHEAALRWYQAQRTAARGPALVLEEAQLHQRLGDVGTAIRLLDSLDVAVPPAWTRQVRGVRLMVAARSARLGDIDSLHARWVAAPPTTEASVVTEVSRRYTSSALPGDSLMIEARLAALTLDPNQAAVIVRARLDGLGWRTWQDPVHYDPDFVRVRDVPALRLALTGR